MADDGQALSLAALSDADNSRLLHAKAVFEEIVKLGEASADSPADSGKQGPGQDGTAVCLVTHFLTVYNPHPLTELREYYHVTGLPGNRKEAHVGE